MQAFFMETRPVAVRLAGDRPGSRPTEAAVKSGDLAVSDRMGIEKDQDQERSS
jgi:hypothetical protein